MHSEGHDRLIRALGADLTPVSPAGRPEIQAAIWLSIVIAIGAVLARFSDLDASLSRLSSAPDMWISAIACAATAVLAAVATFALSRPDRSPAWVLLPVPAVLLWIAASGVGCFRLLTAPETTPASLNEAENCLGFILGLSIPLSILLIVMIRRGFSFWPHLTLMVGGLACAAASASLLNLFHPYDVAAVDIVVHAAAVILVVAANALLGGRILAPKKIAA
jgi:hypothetical protein